MAIDKPWRVALSVIAVAIAWDGPTHAETLKKIWDLDLRRVLDAKGVSHTRALPVFALRFSPDGQRLAAVIDRYGAKGAEKSRLLVVEVGHPQQDSHVFEVEAGADDALNGGPDPTFGWASGEVVHAGSKLIRLGSGPLCGLTGNGVFVGKDLAMARDPSDFGPSRDWTKLVSHFAFFSAECRREGNWEVPEDWYISDASSDRGLLSISRIVRRPHVTESLIVDPLSRKVVQRWSGDGTPAGYFADSGKAMCAGSDVDAADKAPVTCWDVDTGTKIAEAPTVGGGDPIATSQHSSRIIASDWRRVRMPFSREYRGDFRRRVIWDFRTDQELLSWSPDFQSWDFQLFIDPQKPLKHVDEPFRFAISPDGQYIVEGGSGGIHFYRIVP